MVKGQTKVTSQVRHLTLHVWLNNIGKREVFRESAMASSNAPWKPSDTDDFERAVREIHRDGLITVDENKAVWFPPHVIEKITLIAED